MSKKLLSLLILAALVAGILPGAAIAAPPSQPPPPEEGTVYTVQEGDWLSRIAEEEYGDPLAYPAIVLYNNALAVEDSALTVIADPDLIGVGWSIFIPSVEEAEALLVATEALAADEYLDFPWPPPAASATEVVDREYLEAESGETRLRDVDRRLTEALDANGYFETSYYPIPDGFALVTKMEQIHPDGRPVEESRRWVRDAPPFSQLTLPDVIARLFLPQPGFYRVIAFTITPYPFDQSGIEVTPEQAEAWLKSGLNMLPPYIGALDFSREGYTCTALIYEFERPTEAHEVTFQEKGRIQGRTHLVRAGLWESFEAFAQ